MNEDIDDFLNSPEGGGGANNPSFIPAPGPPPFDRERLEKQLFRLLNLEKDELKQYYPSDKALQEFYDETVMKMANTSEPEDTEDEEPMVADNHQLSDDDKKNLASIRKQKAEVAAYKKEQAAKAKAGPKGLLKPEAHEESISGADPVSSPAAAFEAAGKHLPVEDRTSYEDFLKEMKALQSEKKVSAKKPVKKSVKLKTKKPKLKMKKTKGKQ